MSREGQIFCLSPCPLSSHQSFKRLSVVNPNISGQVSSQSEWATGGFLIFIYSHQYFKASDTSIQWCWLKCAINCPTSFVILLNLLLWLRVPVKKHKGCCREQSWSHGTGCTPCNTVCLCTWCFLYENPVLTSPCHSRSSDMFCNHGNVEVIAYLPCSFIFN